MSKYIKFFLPTLVFLVLLEILFRFLDLPPYPKTNNRFLFKDNDYSDFQYSENFELTLSQPEFKFKIFIDSLGLRNNHSGDVDLEKKDDQKRVLFVGDSMTFGFGVNHEDTFTGLIDETEEYEAFNAGVSSYGTLHTLARLKHYGKAIEPDAVLYTIYYGNDLYDNLRGFIKTVEDGYFTEVPNAEKARQGRIMGEVLTGEKPENRSVIDELIIRLSESTESSSTAPAPPLPDENTVDTNIYSESKYVNFIDRILTNNSELYRYFRYKALFIPSVRNIYIRNGVTKIEQCALPYSMNVFHKDFPRNQSEIIELELTLQAILEMKRYVEEDLGAEFVLALFPIKEEVNTKLWEYEKRLGCIDGDAYDLNRPRILLKNFTAEYDVKTIDVLPALKNSAKDPFFKIDTHINEYGHQKVSDFYYEELNKLDL